MLRTVGETAESRSSLRLAAFPGMRGCSVLMESLGRCETGRGGIIGSWVVAMVSRAGDGKVSGTGAWARVDSISWAAGR